jgi:xanthine/uracil/vitamin C permease (AzgA family)
MKQKKLPEVKENICIDGDTSNLFIYLLSCTSSIDRGILNLFIFYHVLQVLHIKGHLNAIHISCRYYLLCMLSVSFLTNHTKESLKE